MKRFVAISIIMGLLISGLFFTGPVDEVEAEEGRYLGNTLYVDDSGGSTYKSIQGAITAASPGDTIYVAPGTYGLISVGTERDLKIIGNATQGDVIVGGSIEFPPLYFYRCTNISVSGLIFRGPGVVASLLESTFITFTLDRFEDSRALTEVLDIRDGDHISLGWCSISSTSDDSFAIKLDHTDNFAVDGLHVNLSGNNAGVVRSLSSLDAVLESVSGTYTGDIVDAESSRIKTVNTIVPDGNVSIDPDSYLDVEFFRRVIVKEEDNLTRIQGTQFELMIDGSPAYRTPHFGGTNQLSNEFGIYPNVPNLVQKKFAQGNTPTYIGNTMKFYYDGLDVPGQVDLGKVNAGTNAELHVLFPDMRVPDPPENVEAETIDHDTIEITFDASPSDDVRFYEIWWKNGTDWDLIKEVYIAMEVVIDELEPGTLHEFRIRAVDDADLDSSWVYVSNTTAPPIEGRFWGTVVYSGGPLNGTAAANVSLFMGGVGFNETWNGTTDSQGKFDLGTVLFRDEYLLVLTPPDVVEDSGRYSGYINNSVTVDFQNESELSFEIDHYEAPPRTEGFLRGRVTYLDGPLQGKNSANATVLLYNSLMTEVGAFTVDETGKYHFEDVPFGYNYTIIVIPEYAVDMQGAESGYIKFEHRFDLLDDTVENPRISYFVYVPPTSGDIFGTIKYEGGFRDGDPASGLEVRLYNGTDKLVEATTTNETGFYRFGTIPFGNGYYVMVTPKAGDLGEEGVATGYLELTHPFDHNTILNNLLLFLQFYELKHPSVKIMDADGEPVPGVVVIVTVDDDTYSEVTNEDGVAEFQDLVGEYFPDGSKFKATKDGYMDIEWTDGEEIPPFEKETEDDNLIFLFVLLAIIMVAVAIAGYLFLRKGPDRDLLEE
ncbi:MAG: fibronectin type III domain-containing protein [Thermoplasmatota archaeon]